MLALVAMADVLSLLIAERDRLNRAIDILQREPKRRGRKPGSTVARGAAAPKKAAKKRRRRRMSSAARKAVSDRMRKYWAARRKASK